MYQKETWLDRVTEYPNRRLLTDVDAGTQTLVTVARSEGTITQSGTAFSAENMNDLESRIEAEANKLEQAITTQQTTSVASKTYYKGDYFVFNGNLYRVEKTILSGSSIPSDPTAWQQTTIMAEIKGAISGVSTLNSQMATVTNKLVGVPRMVTVQVDLTFDADGMATYQCDLSQYKSVAEAYIPVSITGIETTEGFAISITDAHLATYTIAVHRLTGSTAHHRVLLAYYVV